MGRREGGEANKWWIDSYAICFWYGIKLFQRGEIKDPGTIIT